MFSQTDIENGIKFPYTVTEVCFDYIPQGVPPCIYFKTPINKIYICSLPIHDRFFSDKNITNAIEEKTEKFNGLPKTHLDELEIMWISFEGNIVNNIQINGNFIHYFSRKEQKVMYKLLIDTFCKKGDLIPTVETMRERAKELNTNIMESPYASSVYDGPKVVENGRVFRIKC